MDVDAWRGMVDSQSIRPKKMIISLFVLWEMRDRFFICAVINLVCSKRVNSKICHQCNL